MILQSSTNREHIKTIHMITECIDSKIHLQEESYFSFKHLTKSEGPHLKGICYGSDPVVISLQLTNFQSLIGLRMNPVSLTSL